MARIDDLSWGASSSSSKKRSLPQASPSASAKRPKQGPFLEMSSSEDESGSGDDDGCIHKEHIPMAAERPARSRAGGEHRLTTSAYDASLVETNPQGHGSHKAPESSAHRSKPSTPQLLNKDRVRVLLAKKQGVSAAPSSPLRKSANPDIRNRPLNAEQIRQDLYSSALRVPPLSSQRGGRTPVQGEGLLQAHGGRTQGPDSGHATNCHERTHRIFKSTTSREAQAARMQSASNSDSPRDTFKAAKVGYRNAAREEGKTGSTPGIHQNERPSKSARRPEVGARFGHTLRTRKGHKEEKERASSKGAPATKSNEMYQNSELEDRESSGAALARKQTRSSGSTAPSALKTTPPANPTSAFPLEQPSPNARQSTTKDSLPEISGKAISKRGEQPYQSSHATAAVQRGLDGDRSSYQGGTEASYLASIQMDQYGRATSAEGFVSEKIQAIEAAAHGKRSKALTDERARSVIPDAVDALNMAVANPAANRTGFNEPLAVSIGSGAQLKIPTAVMIRPDELCAQNLTSHGSGKSISPGAHVLDNATSRNASPFGIIKRPQTLSDAVKAGADASSALDRDAKHWVSEAPEPMNLSSDNPGSLMPEQDSERVFEPSYYDAVAKQVSLKSTVPAKEAPLKPVEDDPRRRHASASSVSELRQPEGPVKSPATDVDPENTWSQPAASIFPSSDLMPPHTVALEDSADTREAVKDLPAAEGATIQNSTSSAATETTLPSPTISPTTERYFEYSIHRSISLPPSNIATIELSTQPFMTVNGANAQTDKLLVSAKQQYELLGMQCRSTTTTALDTGLSIHEATFISIEDPSKILTLKLWVERAEVGLYANHTPSPSTVTSPLISKTLYALRLWRLVEEATDSDSEAEDEDDDAGIEKLDKSQTRVYQPLPNICTELHTSLDSANRAAKRVQIELSHEKEPKSMQEMWQAEDLRALHRKLDNLKTEINESVQGGGESPSLAEYEEGRRKGCWRSVFNGYGPGGDRFELLVASVGLSGPRNL